ncbi:MAG: helix-turn-helix transcriptional regulator [Pseudomonadota bacterium]
MAKNPGYERFHAAFVYLLNKEWQRKQKALAIDVGVSPGFISDIKSGKNKANDEVQAKFADIMGYPNFDDFIALGRSLIEVEKAPNLISVTSQAANNVHLFPTKRTPLTPEARHRLSMHEALDAIYESGNKVLISAIESNLVAFRESAETKKRVEGLEKDNKIMSDRIQLLEKVIK